MSTAIDFRDIPSIPLLIKDYLNKKKELGSLYDLPISAENIYKKSKTKKENYKYRNLFYTQLKLQHSSFPLSQKQKENIELLQNENTFTLTTGHQLNLFTGPIFFIYKILQTIKTCEELNQKQKKYNYIPIFWMASEDHDFEEINYFNYKGKKYQWNTHQKGAVGEYALDSNFYLLIDTFIKENAEIGNIVLIKELKNKVKKLNTLADFTRYLVNELFKKYGLLIIDGNDKELKKTQIPLYQNELLHQTSYKNINETVLLLKKLKYKIQVNPREINLFYLDENGRNRIEFLNDTFIIKNTSKKFLLDEILLELNHFPERFSPNALLRPLYQETILPNVAYIGGNSEIAYWLELKKLFDQNKISFPIIIPRHSFYILNNNQLKKMKKLSWERNEFFISKENLIKKNIIQNIQVNVDFCQNKRKIQQVYNEMKNEAKKTDISFLNLLNAQEYKQLRAFDQLQKRLLKAEKKKNSDLIERIDKLFLAIFPNNQWQEREINVLEFSKETLEPFFNKIYDAIPNLTSKCFCFILID